MSDSFVLTDDFRKNVLTIIYIQVDAYSILVLQGKAGRSLSVIPIINCI